MDFDYEAEKRKLIERAKEAGIDIDVVDKSSYREAEICKESFLSKKTKRTLTTASIAAAAAVGAVLGADDDLQNSSTMQIINGFATSYSNARAISNQLRQRELEEAEYKYITDKKPKSRRKKK